MLPTRQSLRLRNKDPDGVTLPDLPIKQEPVDEHVSTKKNYGVISEWKSLFLRQTTLVYYNQIDKWSAVLDTTCTS